MIPLPNQRKSPHETVRLVHFGTSDPCKQAEAKLAIIT